MKKIRNILVILMALFLITGCDMMKPSPTKKVEELLSKYKTKDESILSQLKSIVEEAGTMNDTQKSNYQKLMERQYENLNYKIKEEKIDGDNATVIVEIEVYDYGKAITDSETYLASNQNEFLDNETGTTDSKKFLDYKISKMQDVKDKVTYTISFSLTKNNNSWQVDDLNDIDRLKIHGLYY